MGQIYDPCVAPLTGRPRHGKSASAIAIQALSNFEVLDVDVVRKELYEHASGRLLADKSQEFALMTGVYQVVIERATTLVMTGTPVVIAGTFSRQAFKEPLLNFMHDYPSVPVRIFRLEAREENIPARLESAAREGTVSPIKTIEQYRWTGTIVEAWPDEVRVQSVDTDEGIEITVARILTHLVDLRRS